MVEIGSRWTNKTYGFCVIVLASMNLENTAWVYYRIEENTDAPKEESCFEETFLEQFSKN